MKKVKNIFCIIGIIIISSLPFSTSFTYADQQTANTNLQPKILTNINKEKLDPNQPLETEIGDYVGDKNTLINDNGKAMLKSFNIAFDEIKSAKVIKQNNINKKVNRLELNNAQVDLDANGNIVNLINYADRITVGKDKHNFTTVKLPPKPTIKYTSQDNLKNIISTIAQQNNLNGYTLVNSSFDNQESWILTWNKDLGNGLLNPYDVAVAIIDAKDGSINEFTRNTVEPNSTTPIVTKDEAVLAAQPVIDKFTKVKNIDTKLSIFRPNFYWESGDLYKPADFIRLAWKITLDNSATIYVDAETKEILGGGQTKSAARALGPVPTFYHNSDLVSMASSNLNYLGYSQPDPPVTWEVSWSDIDYVMNTAPYYGLYLTCHGFVGGLISDENGKWSYRSTDLKYNSFWTFVYLDACYSAIDSSWPNALGIGGYGSGTAFVGWNNSVGQITSYNFDVVFWQKIGTEPVYQAVLDARAATLRAGYSDCNPGFWGDTSYYGWSRNIIA